MQIINKDLGSYNLHIIKTDQFKTMTMQVIFHTPIIKKPEHDSSILLNKGLSLLPKVDSIVLSSVSIETVDVINDIVFAEE